MYWNHSPNVGSRLGTPQNQYHPIPNYIHVEYQPLATDGGCPNLMMSFWGTSIFVSHLNVARSLNHVACPAGSRFVEASVLMCAAGATILHVGKVRISPMRIAAVTLLSGTSTKFLPILETFLHKFIRKLYRMPRLKFERFQPQQRSQNNCLMWFVDLKQGSLEGRLFTMNTWIARNDRFFCVHVFSTFTDCLPRTPGAGWCYPGGGSSASDARWRWFCHPCSGAATKQIIRTIADFPLEFFSTCGACGS